MESLDLKREIRQQLLLNPSMLDNSRIIRENIPAPSVHRFKPQTETEVIPWEMITSRSVFSIGSSNPRKKIESALEEVLYDVVQEVMDDINAVSRKRGRHIEFREVLYGYHRLVPQFGAEYILDMLLVYKKYRGRKITVPVRRHTYLQHQFTALEIRETFDGIDIEKPANVHNSTFINNWNSQHLSPFQRKITQRTGEVFKKTVHLILPLSGRSETFSRFVKVLEKNCLRNGDKVALIVVLLNSKKDNTAEQCEQVVRNLQNRYPDYSLSVIRLDESFARAKALELGVSYVPDSYDDLLMFIDVDMLFTRETLQRVRLNTIRGKQAYFPIVYSEYNPEVSLSILPDYFSNLSNAEDWRLTRIHDRVIANAGYWRLYGFGIAAMYKSDLKAAGGLDISIRGWGREDVDLFEKILRVPNYDLFRAVDPNLVHMFHVVECSVDLERTQLDMCLGTRVDMSGSVEVLARLLIDSGPSVSLSVSNLKKTVSAK